MKTPFDYIDGQEIDLNNDSHRKTVIERDRRLDYFVSNKTELEEMSPQIKVSATIHCLKCGSEMKNENHLDADDLDSEINECFDEFKCSCCGSSYERILFKNEWRFKVPKQKKLAKS